MDNRAIGVFDSGLGGLTAVKEIMKVMPSESIVYFGDTGRVPYGSRSEETIIKYTKQDINFLKTHNIKIILTACGTASSVALPFIQDEDIKIIGVVEPTVKRAVNESKNKKIGIIGTEGTIKSKVYENEILKLCPQAKVVAKACPMFVPLVENGYLTGKVTEIIAKEYLKAIIKGKCDTLILGCTHYPLIKGCIENVTKNKINLIDAGQSAAHYVKKFLCENDMESKGTAEYRYFVSDECSNFVKSAQMFLQKEIDYVERINIENMKA